MQLVRGVDAKVPRWFELDIDYQCLRTLSKTLRDAKWSVTVTVWNDKEVIAVQGGYHEESYGAAVDIGSTTVALYLVQFANWRIARRRIRDESTDRVRRRRDVSYSIRD
jgi:uncharacterized 2Fe-2S/4Fe-4S cluster protein (DUF4445 family)